MSEIASIQMELFGEKREAKGLHQQATGTSYEVRRSPDAGQRVDLTER